MARNSELVFLPLGGAGEIGMNLALYGSGPPDKRHWLMVDLGIGFTGDTCPGIDVMFPDISFVIGQRKRLAGIVLTHAHEDHYGAVIDLWPSLRVPVYATKFCAALLRAKMAAEGSDLDIDIRETAPGAQCEIGPFSVEFISLVHSIPEPVGVAIRAESTTIFHTGDWKFDDSPVLSPETDYGRLQAIGDAGCRALICDSTNVFREGVSPGEGAVAKTLTRLTADAPRRVVVTSFASNVARICSAARAAIAAQREVVIVGRAMERIVEVARETGYIDPDIRFLSQDMFSQLPANRVMLICTGSQGEPRAALARVAAQKHPSIQLSPDDRVIFSARTIPGNERAVGEIHNRLVRAGIEVITDSDDLVHVSGHPRRGELEKMYDILRPAVAIPVHGEARHLVAHKKFALELGVEEALIAYNGDMVRLSPAPSIGIGSAPSGYRYKDGKLMIDSQDEAVQYRRLLSEVGLIAISLTIDVDGELASDPQAILDGIPAFDSGGDEMSELVLDVVEDAVQSMSRKRRLDQARLAETIRRAVRSCMREAWGKRPVCHVMVHQI